MGEQDKYRGLYEKFEVTRKDGQSQPGEKHNDCEYFVLDLTHDEFAGPALVAYAQACAEKYPKLSTDLLSRGRLMALEVQRADRERRGQRRIKDKRDQDND